MDELVGRLAGSATDHGLEGLEAEVGRRILLLRRQARTTTLLAPVRIASIGLALAMGTTVGGVTAAGALAGPRAPRVFSAAVELAPSTLLEGRR
ncbi:MAG: hypothetical protein ACHP9T_03080 [Caulobacterales bacterium]